MNLKNIKSSIDENGICNIIFDTNNNKYNVFNESSIEDLYQIIDNVINSPNIIGIIFSSAKSDFHQGYDLEYLYSLKSPAEIFNKVYKLTRTLRKLESIGMPITCAISGKSNLGGLELISCCHYRVSDNAPNTQIITKNIKYDLPPSLGGSQRLPRIIGIPETLDLLLNDTTLNTQEALNKNIVDEVVSKNNLIKTCQKYILENKESKQIWESKQNISPFTNQNLGYFISKIAMLHAVNFDLYHSVRILISCIFEGLNTNVDSGLKIEARHFTWLLNNKETRSMLNTLKFNNLESQFDEKIINLHKKSFKENYATEGVQLLIDGISAPLIENAGKRLGFNISPLACADKIELQSIIPNLDSKDVAVAALIRSMQKLNRKGLTSEKGFYEYKDKKRLGLWKGLEDLIPSSKQQPDISYVEERLIFSTINNILYNYSKIENFKNQNLYDYLAIKK